MYNFYDYHSRSQSYGVNSFYDSSAGGYASWLSLVLKSPKFLSKFSKSSHQLGNKPRSLLQAAFALVILQRVRERDSSPAGRLLSRGASLHPQPQKLHGDTHSHTLATADHHPLQAVFMTFKLSLGWNMKQLFFFNGLVMRQ